MRSSEHRRGVARARDLLHEHLAARGHRFDAPLRRGHTRLDLAHRLPLGGCARFGFIKLRAQQRFVCVEPLELLTDFGQSALRTVGCVLRDAAMFEQPCALVFGSLDRGAQRCALAVEVHDLLARARRFLARGLDRLPFGFRVPGFLFRALARGRRFGLRRLRASDLIRRRRFVARLPCSQVVQVRRALRGKAGKRVQAVADRRQAILGRQQALRGARSVRKIGLAPLAPLGQLEHPARDLFHLLDGAPLGLGVFLSGHGPVLEHPQLELDLAQLRLDLRRTFRDFRLPFERPDLTPKLCDDVAQPLDIRIHAFEFAHRALLALSVLQQARRLFDHRAPVFRPPREDVIELPLPDDRVQLATDAGVRKKLLDVEQPARDVVDGVLALPGAEERAADAHLGEVDRQNAARVIDRQLDLGATQSRTLRRPGEDDVFHLAAAQRLRALLPQHPCDRVDEVGLAGAVGPNDDGHTGREIEHRLVGERFEAPNDEAPEKHASC